MMPFEFDAQMNRMKGAFKPADFTEERLKLIWRGVQDLDLEEFEAIVDNFISSSRHAPLPKDFQDASRAARGRTFRADIAGALDALEEPFQEGLKQYLEKSFPGCKTLKEAVEVRRLQIQIAKANDPNYDPMKDPAWM